MKKINTLLFALMISFLGFGQQKINSNDFEISDNNKSISETSNDFNAERNTELVFVKLRISSSSSSYGTDIYFNDNASLGFDFGYDAGFFGVIPDFAIYTYLAQDDAGSPFTIQAVHTTDISNVTIPLGVNANQGEQATFSISDSTLPTDVSVYLDDTVANTSTLLNNTDYIITPSTVISGAGRFILRISEPSTTYTYDGSWSPSDPNGIAAAGDDIVIESGDATINADTTCNSVTVNPGAALIVTSGITLTVTNGLSLESTSTSYSSLIMDGSVTGSLTYERHININGSGTTGSNDLVSAPLTGQAFNLFAAANPNILNNGSLFLFGPFEKTTGSYVNYADTETATLDAGIGYRAATSDNSSVSFDGTAENGIVTNNIINGGSNNAEWNLVGNPYPSYINVQQFLLHDVGGVTNIQLFDAPTAAIYGYDGNALNGWTIYNLANTTTETIIAPGQGFFVSADATNSSLYDLEFAPAMRSTGATDDFILGRNSQLVYLKLKASTNTDTFSTEFYFNSNASLGFDLGYDATFFGNTPDFAIYSHLVQDNIGDEMALQTINSTDFLNVTIPLGVNANQGEQVTLSISDLTLPASIMVYLEDSVANTTTLLNDSDYVFTPTTTLSGTGRFFLRTSEDALSTIENSLDTLNIYMLNNSNELVINGQLQNNAALNLYDIQGRLVLSTQLDITSLENRIDVSSLSQGIYIVNVQNNEQQKSQKVIIK